MKMHRLLALSAALVAAGFGSDIAAAAPLPQCSVRLAVELTPDVPDPQSAGFLSSLLSNHPGYRLEWVRTAGAFEVVLDLTGPGPDTACRNVVQTMRNDARVLSIHDESNLTRLASNVRVSHDGLGSLVWAVGHPDQAWKIVAPVEPPGERVD